MSSTPTTLASPFAEVAASRRLLEGVGDMDPDWMRLNVLGDAIAARLAESARLHEDLVRLSGEVAAQARRAMDRPG